MEPRIHVEQKYIDYWRSKAAREADQIKVWEKEAWDDVQIVASVLREQFHATKIIVFGSLVKNKFGRGSDIDIAAEGMEPNRFFLALSTVNRHSKREIDLKPMEALDPHFRKRVIETGRVISEII
ncbi:nucleotidyltransferase family protein [cf. Phormidesmis sp. LEGE 11477]|uniref:nucleotidyltransferase family protein n=1 Tax=cf. Phormidesmis sp. LEGE 11477 TaxID=1828680 RepID=UPI00187FA84F|nr:nucleotidyltransferase domain-containing protein [cf. Phormidesmis sp. LEGE 11477]MBE9064712.1 nucleotidyltransferase domain-containing protein [cf. Phormidesmis sp. LEGE 11477]